MREARNMEKYGDKLRPSVEHLRGKGKTWQNIIEGHLDQAVGIWIFPLLGLTLRINNGSANIPISSERKVVR